MFIKKNCIATISLHKGDDDARYQSFINEHYYRKNKRRK